MVKFRTRSTHVHERARSIPQGKKAACPDVIYITVRTNHRSKKRVVEIILLLIVIHNEMILHGQPLVAINCTELGRKDAYYLVEKGRIKRKVGSGVTGPPRAFMVMENCFEIVLETIITILFAT